MLLWKLPDSAQASLRVFTMQQISPCPLSLSGATEPMAIHRLNFLPKNRHNQGLYMTSFACLLKSTRLTSNIY
jgi:hypothetical protein